MKSKIKKIPDSIREILLAKKWKDVCWGMESQEDSIIFFTAKKLLDREELLQTNHYSILNDKDSEDISGLKNVTLLDDDLFFDIQKESLNTVLPIEWENKKIIGITGTNGKTSVANFTEQLLNLNSCKAFSVGTLGVRSNNQDIDDINGMTTPDLINLHKCLFKHYHQHDIAVIEVSSHGVALKRIWGLEFDIIAWTNFTQDHLDFHETVEHYFQSKKTFFDNYLKKNGKRFVSDSDPDLLMKLDKKMFKQAGPLDDEYFRLLPGHINSGFNLKNIELAYAIVSLFISKVNYLDRLQSVSGRFELTKKEEQVFIIDYAHTPDALKNVLESAKRSFPDKEMHILFGCGGDRDKTKRPLMGKIADDLADVIYLTSDNPRTENPDSIINDIKDGIKNKKVTILSDRKSAIGLAIKNLPKKGCLIIAGKGHEDYQIIGTEKKYFSDAAELKFFLGEGQ